MLVPDGNPPPPTFSLRVSLGFDAGGLPEPASLSTILLFILPPPGASPFAVSLPLVALSPRLATAFVFALETKGFLGGLRSVRGTGGGMEPIVEELAWLWLLAVLSMRLSEGGWI